MSVIDKSDPLEQRLGVKQADILRVAMKHGAANVRVFGAYARGDQQPDSDVDFIVDAGADTTPFFPGGLFADLEELLHRRVDVVETTALHRQVCQQIL
ncbi:MAG: nucleotidyltransferase domain-containing protein [Chloroflexi bacterium]|nr:nucleotidyltransferase domain-containing protein [Chloroflexota bacterium]MCL5275534.1 nucleotidyltransferase domain-containing protein [Chloroflexota bacterium]